MRDAPVLANVRERSRSARERSRSLRHTSQQLRDSLENLRVYASHANGTFPGDRENSPHPAPEPFPPLPRIPVDFATLLRQRVRKARCEAQVLRRRAADLRSQAAEFRARSEDLRGNSAAI
ncbi:MAG TPA: hypothetical protein VLC12_02450 [Terriglobales bacterium]|nr:hypothetical protein [Terriglobales bacterium]